MSPAVLVTGGAGYVGSHTCLALARAGYLPVAYDDLSQGHSWAVRWGPLEEGELADHQRLDEVIARYQPAGVIHFASSIAAGESMIDPAKYYLNNVAGTLSLLEAMRRSGLDRLVFSSSAAVYGIPEHVPIDESQAKSPVNVYGSTKLMCERILADYAAAYGMRSAALRYFNAAGADPEGEIGEAHEPETHLIPLVLEAASGDRPHVEIFGDRYETRDGTCLRDYVHVSDLAAAHILALKYLAEQPGCSAYNLGSAKGSTVKEVISAVGRVTAKAFPVIVTPPRPGDPPCLIADPRLAISVLGWVPEFSDLETQVRHAWQWHCKGKRPDLRQADG